MRLGNRFRQTVGAVGRRYSIRARAFSQDDKTLVSASTDRTVRVWSLPDGKNTLTLQGVFPKITGLRPWLSARTVRKSRRAVWGSFATRQFPIKIWDLKNNNVGTALLGPNVPISALVFSPDGKTLLSVDGDGGLRLWNTATWKLLAETPVDESARPH